MNTYTVKQIAEMLDTNPETVRRWIREKKLKAIQVSRKEGNTITEDELQRFLNNTPKYASRIADTVSIFSPGLGLAVLAGSIGYGAVKLIEGMKDLDVRVLPEDVHQFLKDSLDKTNDQILQKQNAIHQLEVEIAELKKQYVALHHLLEKTELSIDETPDNESKNELEVGK